MAVYFFEHFTRKIIILNNFMGGYTQLTSNNVPHMDLRVTAVEKQTTAFEVYFDQLEINTLGVLETLGVHRH